MIRHSIGSIIHPRRPWVTFRYRCRRSSRATIGCHGSTILIFKQPASFSNLFLEQPNRRFTSPSKDTTEGGELPYFQDLPNLDEPLKAALARGNLERMTEIQAKTWELARNGKDLVCRAQTGSGKSLAFLLPGIQRIRNEGDSGEENVSMLVIVPTRELAQQVHDMCLSLTQHLEDHSLQLTTQVLYGGVPKWKDLKALTEKTPRIVIATPGRLLDHLGSTYVHDRLFRDCFKQLKVLVLDEMDRLLDMGFREDIQQVLSFLPTERQSMLFSATVPPDVKEMASLCVKRDYIFVDFVNDNDPSSQTNKMIRQSYITLPLDKIVTGVVQLVLELMKQPLHKVLVFFPTTNQVQYFANLFNHRLGIRMLDIHAKKSQPMRTVTSQQFRNAKKAVMFTTDLSARGVDYPDVTHVVQIGTTQDREAYVHRLGRTGRAGKRGEGILVLLEAEKPFIKQKLSGFKFWRNRKLESSVLGPENGFVKDEFLRIGHDIQTGAADDFRRDIEAAYTSMIGYYNSTLRAYGDNSIDDLVDIVNSFANQAGLRELPSVSEKLARQAGLLGHPRINAPSHWQTGDRFQLGPGDANVGWDEQVGWKGRSLRTPKVKEESSF